MQGQQNHLKHLITNITEKSIITILDISNNEIILEIGQTQLTYQKTKQKHYKIKYDHQKTLENIFSIIRAYPQIKCKIMRKNWKLLTEAGKDILFSEVIVEANQQQDQQWMIAHISKVNSQKFIFLNPLSIPTITSIYANLYQPKSINSKLFEVEFNLLKMAQCNIAQVTSLVELWAKVCNQKYSNDNLFQYQLEKLRIIYQGQLLLCLENKKLYGFSICLYKYSSDVMLCLGILQIFVNNKLQKNKEKRIFVSIQFLDWQPKNIQPVNYVFKNYQHRNKYLIKFGNYLEITQLRLFINTTGMQKSQVASVFNLMKQPGHYQLICHSNKQYFEQAINLFLYKPLINFKYYVPLCQAQQLQKPIEAMMQKADLLKKKIQIFMRMLKSPYNIDLSTVIKLFLTMSKTNITQ